MEEKKRLWEDVCKEYGLTGEQIFCRTWKELSESPLPVEFLRDFQDKIDWKTASICQRLSEDSIREFQDRVDWTAISKYQNLSEDFIREFKDKVDWIKITKYQEVSDNFLIEFKDKLNWDYIYATRPLTEELDKAMMEAMLSHLKFELSDEFKETFGITESDMENVEVDKSSHSTFELSDEFKETFGITEPDTAALKGTFQLER